MHLFTTYLPSRIPPSLSFFISQYESILKPPQLCSFLGVGGLGLYSMTAEAENIHTATAFNIGTETLRNKAYSNLSGYPITKIQGT